MESSPPSFIREQILRPLRVLTVIALLISCYVLWRGNFQLEISAHFDHDKLLGIEKTSKKEAWNVNSINEDGEDFHVGNFMDEPKGEIQNSSGKHENNESTSNEQKSAEVTRYNIEHIQNSQESIEAFRNLNGTDAPNTTLLKTISFNLSSNEMVHNQTLTINTNNQENAQNSKPISFNSSHNEMAQNKTLIINTNSQEQPQNSGLMLVNPPGFLLDRIKVFNTLLHEYRNDNLINDLGEWVNPQLTNLKVVQERGNFLKSASIDKGIALLSRTWQALNSNENYTSQLHNLAASDLLITKNYKTVASETFCTLFVQKKLSGKCFTNHSELIDSELLFPDFNDVLLYLLPFDNSVINWRGYFVHSKTKLASDGCKPETFTTFMVERSAAVSWKRQIKKPSIQSVSRLPLYDEVFVISQYWGDFFYHRIAENLPRLAAFLPFLRANPDIKIHAADNGEVTKALFRFLELDPNRIVTGAVRARLAYIPKGSPCGAPGYVELQLLSHQLQSYVEHNLKPGRRNRVILINRSKSRKLKDYTNILKDVKLLTEKYGFTFTEWRDDPPAPLHEGFKLFYEAVMIVAPHGAGEVNMIAARVGTYQIEIVNSQFNTCYLTLAHRLGHRYHGLAAKGIGTLDIESRKVAAVVETYLRQLRNL